MVICLECGANELHMAQLMPLPYIISCFNKIKNGLPFWCRLTQVDLEKRPLNVCVCVWFIEVPSTGVCVCLVISSQQVFKQFSIWTNTCSHGRVNNVLLQTARHQQGAASAH